MAKVPASIRFKNPGAMWGNNPVAKKWGALETVVLNDGKGQGNNIAVFNSYVDGICAQLDLWRTSKHYRNKRFAEAIRTWSGGNSVNQYIAFVTKRVPGVTADTVMDDTFWRGDMAIPFLKAQAAHEAGRVYPAPEEDWIEAKRRVMEGGAFTRIKNALPSAVTAARTTGLGLGTVAAAVEGTKTITGPVQSTVDQVTVIKDTANNVVGVSKDVVHIVPEGVVANVWHFVASPGFLATALIITVVAWGVTYMLRNRNDT